MRTASILLVSLSIATALADTNTTEIPVFNTYDIGFADASNAVEVVRTVVAPDGKVFYDPATRKLMVLATSNRLDAVAGVVKQLNVPPNNVSVTVRFLGQGTSRRRGASLSGGGGVIVTGGRARSSITIQPEIKHQTTETSTQTSQQLLVSSGRQASIFIGEEVPYMEWLMEYGRRHHYFEGRIAWQKVGASLVIEPLVVGRGPLIRLRLTPELSGTVDGNPYRTRFANVATEVTVTDGVPFPLGGLSEKNDFFSRFLVGVDDTGQAHNLQIELTARIIPPSGAEAGPSGK